MEGDERDPLRNDSDDGKRSLLLVRPLIRLVGHQIFHCWEHQTKQSNNRTSTGQPSDSEFQGWRRRIFAFSICFVIAPKMDPPGLADSSSSSTSALVLVDLQNDFVEGALAVPNASVLDLLMKPPDSSVCSDAALDRCNHLVTDFAWPNLFVTLDWHPAGHASFFESHKPDNPDLQMFDRHRLLNGYEQVMWPTHCVQNTWGSELHPKFILSERAASDSHNVQRIYKGEDPSIDSYSAFFDVCGIRSTRLGSMLEERHIQHIILAGLAFDFCVGWSALDAIKWCEKQRQNQLQTGVVCVIEDACASVDPEVSSQMRQQLIDAGVKLLSFNEFNALVEQHNSIDKAMSSLI